MPTSGARGLLYTITQCLLVQSGCSICICRSNSIIAEPAGDQWLGALFRTQSWPETQTGLGLGPSEPRSGASFMYTWPLTIVWLCPVIRHCGGGPGASAASVLQAWQNPSAASLLPASGSRAPRGSLVRQRPLFLFLLRPSWFPLAVSGWVGSQGSLPLICALGGGSVAMPRMENSSPTNREASHSLLTPLP